MTKYIKEYSKWVLGLIAFQMYQIGKSPLDFTSHDFKQLVTGLWFAVLPVIGIALVPGGNFGVGSKNETVAQVAETTAPQQ